MLDALGTIGGVIFSYILMLNMPLGPGLPVSDFFRWTAVVSNTFKPVGKEVWTFH